MNFHRKVLLNVQALSFTKRGVYVVDASAPITRFPHLRCVSALTAFGTAFAAHFRTAARGARLQHFFWTYFKQSDDSGQNNDAREDKLKVGIVPKWSVHKSVRLKIGTHGNTGDLTNTAGERNATNNAGCDCVHVLY